MNELQKPAKRSKWRRKLGALYYRALRYKEWLSSTKAYCHSHCADMPFVYAQHSSTFMRPLKNVEMQLQENKKRNIALACARLNQVCVAPGETLSFWRLVGCPTRLKGYLDGLILFQGSLTKGAGGGICQLSNLIYWLTLHTPLQVTERWRHSYDVFPDVNRTLPFGSGATVSYNYIDLQIFNPTAEHYQLKLWQDETTLFGEWRSEFKPEFEFEVLEKSHRIDSLSWGGYSRHNEIYRTVRNISGGELTEEFITANNALMMYNPLLEAGKTSAS